MTVPTAFDTQPASARPSRGSGLSAIIFDVDGTLADTEEAHRRAFNWAFEQIGLPVYWDPAEHRRRLPGGAGPERLAALLSEPHLAASVGDGPARAEMIAAIHKLKTDHYVEAMTRGEVSLRPGVLRLMREAVADGVVLAVASSAAGRSVWALLAAKLPAAIRAAMPVVLAGDDVTRRKPHPDIYERCLAELAGRGIAPHRTVVIEDSRIGLLAAMGAGLTTVVTHNHWTCDQDFTGAALVANSLGEPAAVGGPPCCIEQSRLTLATAPECLTVAHLEALLTA